MKQRALFLLREIYHLPVVCGGDGFVDERNPSFFRRNPRRTAIIPIIRFPPPNATVFAGDRWRPPLRDVHMLPTMASFSMNNDGRFLAGLSMLRVYCLDYFIHEHPVIKAMQLLFFLIIIADWTTDGKAIDYNYSTL